MPYGLNHTIIEQINGVFKNHTELDRVILYGSRAKGNYKNGSDIDLTIIGNQLELQLTNKIENELDDLWLPYTFDVSIYSHIKNKNLLEHINHIGKELYKKSKI